jgi:hypothetical protein
LQGIRHLFKYWRKILSVGNLETEHFFLKTTLYNVVARKPEGKSPLKSWDNTKSDVEEADWPVTSCCAHGNKSLVVIKLAGIFFFFREF